MQHGVPMRDLVADWKKWSRAERVLAVMGTSLMGILRPPFVSIFWRRKRGHDAYPTIFSTCYQHSNRHIVGCGGFRRSSAGAAVRRA
jgi:hypothetical protein